MNKVTKKLQFDLISGQIGGLVFGSKVVSDEDNLKFKYINRLNDCELELENKYLVYIGVNVGLIETIIEGQILNDQSSIKDVLNKLGEPLSIDDEDDSDIILSYLINGIIIEFEFLSKIKLHRVNIFRE